MLEVGKMLEAAGHFANWLESASVGVQAAVCVGIGLAQAGPLFLGWVVVRLYADNGDRRWLLALIMIGAAALGCCSAAALIGVERRPAQPPAGSTYSIRVVTVALLGGAVYGAHVAWLAARRLLAGTETDED